MALPDCITEMLTICEDDAAHLKQDTDLLDALDGLERALMRHWLYGQHMSGRAAYAGPNFTAKLMRTLAKIRARIEMDGLASFEHHEYMKGLRKRFPPKDDGGDDGGWPVEPIGPQPVNS